MNYFKLVYLIYFIQFFLLTTLGISHPSFKIIYNELDKEYYIGEEIVIEAKIKFPKEIFDDINNTKLIIVNSLSVDPDIFYINQRSTYSPSVINLEGLSSDENNYYKTIYSGSIYPNKSGSFTLPNLSTTVISETHTGKKWEYVAVSNFEQKYISPLPLDTVNFLSDKSSMVDGWDIKIEQIPDSIIEGMPFSLSVVVFGNGNPNLTRIDDTELYDKYNVASSVRDVIYGDGIIEQDRVIYSYTITSKDIEIDNISHFYLNYYNIENDRWEQKKTEAIQIQVMEGVYSNKFLVTVILLMIIVLFVVVLYRRSLSV